MSETLKGLFPERCRFSQLSVNIKAVRNDTGHEFIAPVPVCLIQKSWKEM